MTAVVTGGSRGIGRAIVRELARCGYFVYFTYRSREKEAAQLESELGSDKARSIGCSITDEDSVEQLFELVCQDGASIDLLVNNAGITNDKWYALTSIADFRQVIDTNLVGTARLVRRFVRKMMQQKSGTIINISSVSGLIAPEGQASYAASKAGIIAFTKSVARELGRHNIRVVGVAPGFVKTEMYGRVPSDLKKKQLASVALGRAAEPEEIARVVRFLASEDATYITGSTIVVDGGLS